MIKQLEEDGYVKSEWEETSDQEGAHWNLQKIWLTTKGRELLHTLHERSRAGRWKKRIIDLSWVIGTAIATTLITLHVKSCV